MRRLISCAFALVFLLGGQRASAWIYIGGYDSYSLGILWRANADGSNVEEILREWPSGERLSGISQLAVDLDAGKLYWAGGGIIRANLDGSGLERIIPEGSLYGHATWGVAVDTVRKKVYWADRDLDKIWRANVDGSAIETVLTGLDNPRHLALDTSNDKVYWTQNRVSGPNNLHRANLDGTGVDLLASGGRPDGLALDLAHGKVYWTDIQNDLVERANLDGTSREVIVSGTGGQGLALDLDSDTMYWTKGGGIVRSATLEGANNTIVVEMPGRNFTDVILVPGPSVPEPSSFALWGMGAVVLAACAWRRRRRTG